MGLWNFSDDPLKVNRRLGLAEGARAFTTLAEIRKSWKVRLTLLLLLLFLFPVRMTDPRRRRVGCEQDHTAVTSRASQSELPLTFGLGKPEAGKTVSIEIVWPSGQKEALSKISAIQFVMRTKASLEVGGQRLVRVVPLQPGPAFLLHRLDERPPLRRREVQVRDRNLLGLLPRLVGHLSAPAAARGLFGNRFTASHNRTAPSSGSPRS